MEISGIDKGFINIIKYLNENGFKTFSSCDGIEANHIDKSSVTLAYIAFLKSEKIIDLMAAFLRDKENFTIMFSTATSSEPYELYGNMIEGNRYGVYFLNTTGFLTSYFEKIIKGVTEKQIDITENEKQMLKQLDNILENDKNSDLCININFNSDYQPFMNKKGRINVLKISTKEGKLKNSNIKQKEGYRYSKNIKTWLDYMSNNIGIPQKTLEYSEKFDEDEFIVPFGNSYCEIYFKDENIEKILEHILFLKDIEGTLPICEDLDVDYSSLLEDDELYYDEDEQEW